MYLTCSRSNNLKQPRILTFVKNAILNRQKTEKKVGRKTLIGFLSLLNKHISMMVIEAQTNNDNNECILLHNILSEVFGVQRLHSQ